MEYINLSNWQVGIAALLVLLNGAISLALQLGISRKIVWAAIRTVVQLSLLGWILDSVFGLRSVLFVTALMLVMTVIAGLSAVQRVHRRYRGIWIPGLLAVSCSSWLVTGIALVAVVQVRPWYAPQYAIPLLGMILGNTLNGISLGLDRLTDDLSTQRLQVEGMLALGATRWEAALPFVRNAVRTGMVPILNTMMVVGLVSLPGMMTGQLLAGVEPIEAVKYQIVIMFLIAAGTALGTVTAVLLAYRQRFTDFHQLRQDA